MRARLSKWVCRSLGLRLVLGFLNIKDSDSEAFYEFCEIFFCGGGVVGVVGGADFGELRVFVYAFGEIVFRVGSVVGVVSWRRGVLACFRGFSSFF